MNFRNNVKKKKNNNMTDFKDSKDRNQDISTKEELEDIRDIPDTDNKELENNMNNQDIKDAQNISSHKDNKLPQKRKKKKSKKRWLIVGVVVIFLLVSIIVIIKKKKSAVPQKDNIQSVTVENGTVSNTIVGTGTLELDVSEEIIIPSDIAMKEVKVESGDYVSKGDVLATVDKSSVLDVMSDVQDEIKEIDEQITSCKNGTDTETIKASVSGTVQKIYGGTGESALDCIEKYGSVLTITAGDTGETIEITDGMGSISSISVSTGETVSVGESLYKVANDEDSEKYKQLISERKELAALMKELAAMAKTGKITASMNGILGSVNVEGTGKSTGTGSDSENTSNNINVSSTNTSTNTANVTQTSTGGNQVTSNFSESANISKMSSNLTASVSTAQAVSLSTLGMTGNTTLAATKLSNFTTSEETTTETPKETKTEAPEENTTEASEETTMEKPEETTTETPEETTTQASQETTTQAKEETTTQKQEETTTQNKQETTTQKQQQEAATQNTAPTGNAFSGTNKSAGSTPTTSTESQSSSVVNSSTETTVGGITQITAFTFASEDTMCLSVNVDELDINSVEVDQEAEITMDAFEGDTFTGTVTKVNQVAESSGSGSTKYVVTISLSKNEDMKAGMNASATIVVEKKENVLTIPVNALQERRESTFVYTKQESDGTLSGEVEVTTGLSDGTTVEIVEGISEGDTIYYQKSGNISSGDFGGFGNFNKNMGGTGGFSGAPGNGGGRGGMNSAPSGAPGQGGF